jgi:hypothetical protein
MALGSVVGSAKLELQVTSGELEILFSCTERAALQLQQQHSAPEIQSGECVCVGFLESSCWKDVNSNLISVFKQNLGQNLDKTKLGRQ